LGFRREDFLCGKLWKIRPFILEAGTYIIAVSSTESEFSLHEYILRVEAQDI